MRKRQHEAPTISSAEAEDGPRRKRAQVSRACTRCKSLQKGCSESRPCRRCVKAGLPCIDDTPPEAAPTPVENPSPYAAMAPFIDLPATSPQSWMASTRQDGHLARTPNLMPEAVLDHCISRFFDKLFVTLPLLTVEYVHYLRKTAHTAEGDAAYCLLTALCSHVLLLTEEPTGHILPQLNFDNNLAYGRVLLSEAIMVRGTVQKRPIPTTFENVLATFFIYSCESSLSHHSLAFYYLREATTLYLLLKTDSDTMDGLQPLLAERLFWILLVSERAHALRYRRPTTLQITASTPALSNDNPLAGLQCLAALFVPLNSSFVALLNQEVQQGIGSAELLSAVEDSIMGAIDHSATLSDEEKANLRVTQLWLGILCWQVRLRLGLLSEQADSPSSAYQYPLEIARSLTLSIRDLPVESIQIHGVGLTEKLFDISCALIDVLARVPLTDTGLSLPGLSPRHCLLYLSNLIAILPGAQIYSSLLASHREQTLPDSYSPT
jgi:hypothetical protein